MSDTWVPTPADQIPTPSVILGHLQPALTDPASGYITPSDMTSIVQALLSISYELARVAAPRSEVGDVSLLTVGVPERDLVHKVLELEWRISQLEDSSAPFPTRDGVLYVDQYSGSFIRIRDVDGILDGENLRVVTMQLATTAGPGGVVIDPADGVPAGSAGVWYDANGSLGSVVGSTGTNVSQTTLRNWVKYGNVTHPPYYLMWVRVDSTTDPSHPRLVVEKVVNVA